MHLHRDVLVQRQAFTSTQRLSHTHVREGLIRLDDGDAVTAKNQVHENRLLAELTT